MVEIEKIVFNKEKDIYEMSLVSLFREDIEMVKNFVLKQHCMLERKDFFIIEDLDTELPLIFEQDKGAVYGIFWNERLVALQAIDFSSKNDKMLRPYVQMFLEKNYHIYEMGWTLVDQKFRGCHIAEYLLKYMESKINNSSSVLVATVHPQNVKALELYLKSGFKGYAVDEYYGYCRMFLIKTSLIISTASRINVECTDLEKIQEMLDMQYICVEIIKREGQAFLSFACLPYKN